MSYICDPIVLTLSFDAVSANAAEPVMNRILSAFLMDVRPFIRRWIEEVGSPNGLFFSGCLGADGPAGCAVELSKQQWSDLQINEWLDTIVDETGRKGTVSWSIYDVRIKDSMKKHRQKPNALFREYAKCFCRDTFCLNRAQWTNLLNCPNESLSDLQFPVSEINQSFFRIAEQSYPLHDGWIANSGIQLIGTERQVQGDQYWHELSISIPRVVLESSGMIHQVQQSMFSALYELGCNYPDSRGSIRMDLPLQYSSAPLNVFDYDHWYRKSRICYGSCLPGYSWGMLWNKDLASLIPLTEEDERNFAKVLRLPNGSLWLQCSDWADSLTRQQNTKAVKTLAKHTPLPAIPLVQGMFPPSVRFAIDEQDIVQASPDDQHVMAWIHCSSESTGPSSPTTRSTAARA